MPRSAVLIVLVALLAGGCGGHARHARQARAPRAHRVPAARVRVPEACTNVWSGPRRGGLWGDASNWSQHRVPGSGDQACLDRGTSVLVHGGDYATGSLIAGGALTLSAARLRVVDPLWRVEIGGLRLLEGELSTAGPLEITQRLSGTHGHIDFHHGFLISPAADFIGRATIRPDPVQPGASSGTPPATACGPHSPPALQACAGDDTPLSRGARATWRRFARLVNAAAVRDANGLIAASSARTLLAPRACVRKQEPLPDSAYDRWAKCGGTVDRLVRSASASALRTWVEELVVVGHRAYGYVERVGPVRLVLLGGRWRITHLFADSR